MTLRKEEAARSRTSNHSPAWHGAELLAQARSGKHYRITKVVTVMARGRFAEIGLSEGDEIACVENRDGSMTLERPDAEHVSFQRDFAWFAYVRPIPAAPWRAAHAPVEVGDEAPDFVIDTTEGVVRFPEWKRGDWAVLVSYPGDFTPVCTTELAALAALSSDFEKRGTKVMAIGVDPLALHHDWLHDIERLAGRPVSFPIAADPDRTVTTLYGMIRPGRERTAARSTLIVDPENRVRLRMSYPECTGRDFKEILRVIDSLQLATRHGVATPADWRVGRDVVLPVEMPPEEAERRFGPTLATRAPYLRTVSQPT